MHYILVDLEATCCDDNSFPKHECEIIEIGAVLLDESFNEVSRFSAIVRPIIHPTLTPFCTKLTSIDQQMVDNGCTLNTAALLLKQWWNNQILERTEEGSLDVIWGSWGGYDRNKLMSQCQAGGIAWPLPNTHVNFKKLIGKHLKHKPRGLARTFSFLGIKFEGTLHRGVDDASAIGAILRHCKPTI